MTWIHDYSRLGSILVCFVSCLLASGCSKSHGWGGPQGIHDSNCWVKQLLCDARLFMVLAASACSDGTSSGEGNGSFTGELVTQDGRKFAWSCSTSDGVSGTVMIDGQNFKLRDGAVFLVRTNEPKAKVQQLAVEMSKLQNPLPPDRPLEAWGKVEPRIAEFAKEAEANP
jgi:hypothetical protein